MPAPIPAGRTRAREGYDDTDDECELKSTIVGPKALLQYLCMAHCNLPHEDMIIPNKVKVIVNQRLNTMANHNSFCVYLRKTVHALLNCGHEKLLERVLRSNMENVLPLLAGSAFSETEDYTTLKEILSAVKTQLIEL